MGQRSNIFLILISFTLASASAGDAITSPPDNGNSGAYLTDSAGNAIRGGAGDCWRAGIWTPALANLVGCDGVMAKALPKPSTMLMWLVPYSVCVGMGAIFFFYDQAKKIPGIFRRI